MSGSATRSLEEALAAVSFDDVREAQNRLTGVARRTPIMTCAALDAMVGGRVVLKCENLQRVGAFKFRGAYNAIASLSDEERARGVLTYSSGNHAQGIALAGALLGVRTTIVMPSDAPTIKRQATEGYQRSGADLGSCVVGYDREEITREEVAARLVEEHGYSLIPPYDHPKVIAGQGTVALQLIEQVGDPLDELWVCCGGGGLLSGCATAAKALLPECRVVGVEPEAGDDATRSFQTKTLQSVHNPDTIADGARTPSLGQWTFPLVLGLVDDMVTVSDRELVDAMKLCLSRLKIVVEPSGVLGLAGLIKHAQAVGGLGGKRIGVVISGGNIDLPQLAELIGEG